MLSTGLSCFLIIYKDKAPGIVGDPHAKGYLLPMSSGGGGDEGATSGTPGLEEAWVLTPRDSGSHSVGTPTRLIRGWAVRGYPAVGRKELDILQGDI